MIRDYVGLNMIYYHRTDLIHIFRPYQTCNIVLNIIYSLHLHSTPLARLDQQYF